MNALNPREQRLIALLILLLVIAGLWLLLLAPLLDGYADRRAERVRLAQTLDRNERLIAAMPQIRRQFEEQRIDRARFALAAASRETGADLLRQRLQRSFEQSGASLSAVGDSPAPVRWVGASAEGAASLDQLVRLLAALHNQPPFLVVTGLTVVADRAFQSGKLDVMNVKIDVAIPHSQTA